MIMRAAANKRGRRVIERTTAKVPITVARLSVNQAVWFFRVALFALPVISGFVAYRLCIELQRRDGPPPLPTVPVPDTETDGSAGTQDPALVGEAGGGQRHDGSDPADA